MSSKAVPQWQNSARSHAECFREFKPAATMAQVQALLDPAMLIEIEVDAVVEG